MIPALGGRRIRPEILDTLSPEEGRASLADLVRLNRTFGGHSTLRALMREAEPDAAAAFSFLDVGGASGDMSGEVRRWYPLARTVVLDHVASHMAQAPAPKVTADAFRLPFRDGAFDFVFSSLFLHHFEDADVVRLLRESARVARRAVLAIDLIRSPLAYWFLPATRPLFGWDRVTCYDGPISFAAAFRRGELVRLARQAGLARAAARSFRPAWRIALLAPK